MPPDIERYLGASTGPEEAPAVPPARLGDEPEELIERAVESVLEQVPVEAEGEGDATSPKYQPWAENVAPPSKNKRPLEELLAQYAERVAAEPTARAGRPRERHPALAFFDRFGSPRSGRGGRGGRDGRAERGGRGEGEGRPERARGERGAGRAPRDQRGQRPPRDERAPQQPPRQERPPQREERVRAGEGAEQQPGGGRRRWQRRRRRRGGGGGGTGGGGTPGGGGGGAGAPT